MAITSWYAVTVDSTDARKVAEFWSSATGWPIDESASSDTRVVIHPDGGPQISFTAVPETKTVKNRLHLDIVSDNFASDAARIEMLGATKLRAFDGWTTYLDVEGNEFDLIGS